MALDQRQMNLINRYIIVLTVGEPDFDTPGLQKNGAKKAIDRINKYVPHPFYDGTLELKMLNQKISILDEKDTFNYNLDQIIVSA